MITKTYPQELSYALQAQDIDIDFVVLKDTSTNKYAIEHQPVSTPFLIVAISQKDGQGRCGRSFHSAEGGAYFTLQFLTTSKDFTPDKFTLTAGVAVAKTLHDLPVRLKWPNDIFIGDKKLGGILCSSKPQGEKILVNCGIGINVNNKVSVDSAACLANYTSIWQPAMLIACTVKNLINLLEWKKSEVIALYKQYSNVLGRKVKIISTDSVYTALAKDIAENGALIVEKDGELVSIFSGDVSLLPIKAP